MKMVMWLDPSVSGSVTLSPLVTHIDDLSNSGHGATQTASNPSLSSGPINGLDAMLFSGVQWLTIEGGGVTCGNQMVNISVFTRAAANVVSSPTGHIDGQYTGWWPFYWIGNTQAFSSYGPSTLTLASSSLTGTFVVTTIVNGTSITVRRNGALWGNTANAGTRGPVPMKVIGRTGYSGYPHNGLVGELISCDSIVDYEKYEGYIAHKWGVTLDAAHPYFTAPPYDPFWTNFHGQTEI